MALRTFVIRPGVEVGVRPRGFGHSCPKLGPGAELQWECIAAVPVFKLSG